MKLVIVFIIIWCTQAAELAGSEAVRITTRLAALKAKTQRVMTTVKDVSPLFERIDKDLLMLEAKKHELFRIKRALQQQHTILVQRCVEKQQLLAEHKIQKEELDRWWRIDSFQLEIFAAQRGIQAYEDVVAVEELRATLLTQILTSQRRVKKPMSEWLPEDVRG